MRQCGGCTACCTTLEIPPLYKPAGVSCHNLTEKGCSIYPQRPEVPCRSFQCAWLQGHMEDDDRPDKSGAIVWQVIEDEKPVTILSVVPGMEPRQSVVEFANSLPFPVRVEQCKLQ